MECKLKLGKTKYDMNFNNNDYIVNIRISYLKLIDYFNVKLEIINSKTGEVDRELIREQSYAKTIGKLATFLNKTSKKMDLQLELVFKPICNILHFISIRKS